VLGQARVAREQIHYRLSNQYAVNGAFTRFMNAFIDACEGAHPEIDIATCSISTLAIRMMWVSTDIDHVVAIG
jgi:hypothetical protein